MVLNKVKYSVPLTPSCSSLHCSHSLQANSLCFVLHVDTLIIRGILLASWVLPKPPCLIFPSLDIKEGWTLYFLKMDVRIRSPIFLAGASSITTLFLTPNTDIFSLSLSKRHWAYVLWTSNRKSNLSSKPLPNAWTNLVHSTVKIYRVLTLFTTSLRVCTTIIPHLEYWNRSN